MTVSSCSGAESVVAQFAEGGPADYGACRRDDVLGSRLPWKVDPSLTLWAAIGPTIRSYNRTLFGSHRYSEPALPTIAALHVGWELEIS